MAAPATVVPHTPASAIRTDNSGSQRRRQLSRKVPGAAGGGHIGHGPVDPKQPQPVQQATALQVGLLAQIELQLALRRLRFEPERALLPRQIPLKRHRGRTFRHLTQHVTDDEPVLHEGERYVRALAHHSPYGVGGLGQPGQRPAAHGGEGLGEPYGLDDMGGGDAVVLVTQQTRHLRHPARDDAVGCREEMPVPAG